MDWEFTTKCGRKVYLEGVHFCAFASGVYEGNPATVRGVVLDGMADWARRIFGSATGVWIEPLTDPADKCPNLVYFCQFICYQPISPPADCSALVACWFADEVAEPVRDFIAARIAMIDWGQHAADGYW